MNDKVQFSCINLLLSVGLYYETTSYTGNTSINRRGNFISLSWVSRYVEAGWIAALHCNALMSMLNENASCEHREFAPVRITDADARVLNQTLDPVSSASRHHFMTSSFCPKSTLHHSFFRWNTQAIMKSSCSNFTNTVFNDNQVLISLWANSLHWILVLEVKQ
jgi:hypothetical protein